MTDFRAEKSKLIEALQEGGISDESVLSAIADTPRELFIPETFKNHAYENSALPIDRGQTISQPLVVAKMTEALEVHNRHKVLEIGTGSGYQAYILSKLCRRLFTIERHRLLMQQAEKRFQSLRAYNITTMRGDGGRGWPEQAPFERIMVTAAAEDIPPVLIDQLTVGGIMIVPIGAVEDHQDLLKVTKTESGIDVEDMGPVRFVPLVSGLPTGG
ncbi:protein-L-isoaspartate(D-aspartate) O-methyltransferase [Curvivirga aplysinae]|uniref:protein-L-isoaspartate(D-aspartate) O-methyltransferase n=1 Tax=Curvivirga aplysinae TaxID=2529852 RepID=UPI0012BD77AD|nr:protein-L-isoaspartate(D-aspartate) O-methyltransferase [Curvivirga aplysinae]MTI10707.1 protein-L-isoaspartate(D-aspartate) O-methyltransferase [Curvivirga aplysinae]